MAVSYDYAAERETNEKYYTSDDYPLNDQINWSDRVTSVKLHFLNYESIFRWNGRGKSAKI